MYPNGHGSCNSGNNDQYSFQYQNDHYGSHGNQYQLQASSLIQKPVSTQKEKHYMVNHVLGKELAIAELVFQRCGEKLEPTYGAYLAEVSHDASLTDLLRSIKSFNLSLFNLTMDAPEALAKALSSKSVTSLIKQYTQRAKTIGAQTETEAIAKKVLLHILCNLKESKVELISAEISNAIYSHNTRNIGAERLMTHSQDEMVQNVHKAQQGINKLTSQIQSKDNAEPEFTPKPDLHFTAADFITKNKVRPEEGNSWW